MLDGREVQHFDQFTCSLAAQGKSQQFQQGDGDRVGLAGRDGSQPHMQWVWAGSQDRLGQRRIGIEVSDGHHDFVGLQAGDVLKSPQQFVAKDLQFAARAVAAVNS